MHRVLATPRGGPRATPFHAPHTLDPPPALVRSARVPSLDGLRAVSIVAVVLGHLTGTHGFPRALTPVLEGPYLDLAHMGVRVFFVISGFLITGLLVADAEQRTRVSLAQFYLRRTLRIVPAYVAYLSAVVIAGALGLVALDVRDVGHALTYTVNYEAHPSWVVGHLWSLAVEEQFYLLWPVTLVLASRRRAAFVALLTVLVVPWLRLFGAMDGEHVGVTFQTAADALAMGCLMALWRDELRAVPLLRQWWLAPVLLGLSVMSGTFFYRLGMLTQDSLAGLACAALVWWCVEQPRTWVGRVLNTRAFVLVGMLSYSLYLWQQPFLNRYSTAWSARFPINVLLAVACALASYSLVERPFLALRHPAESP